MNRSDSHKTRNILLTALLIPTLVILINLLVNNRKNPYELKSKPDFQAVIADSTSTHPQVALTVVQEGLDDKTAKVTIEGSYDEYKQENGNTIFSGIDKDTDVVYKRVENGIKEDIVIQTKPVAPPVYRFSFETDGMRFQEFEGNYYLFDEHGFARFQIPKPFMVDAAGNRSDSVSISFKKTGAGYRSTVVPDFNWLSSPDRKYPVSVDPSILLPDKPLVEIANRRTINTKTYYLGANKFATKADMDNIHYKDDSGNWQDKDDTIVPSNDPEYDFMNVTNNAKVYFSSKGFSNNKAVKYQVGDAWMKFTLVGATGKGELNQVDENIFEFKDTYQNDKGSIDTDYTVSDGKVVEEIILNEFGKLPELNQEVELHNAYFIEKDEALYAYKNNTSELLWIIPRPVMYEMGDKNVRNYGLHYEIKSLTNGNILLTKVIDQEGKNWLEDSLRTYPIAIDISAGPNSPGGVTELTESFAASWLDTSYVMTADSNVTYAWDTTPASGGELTRTLKVYNFGFNLAEEITIDGIMSTILGYTTETEDGGYHYEWIYYSQNLIKSDGNLSSGTYPNYIPTSIDYWNAGASDYLWEETWDYTDINDADFGFACRYQIYKASTGTGMSLEPNSLVATPFGSKKISDFKVGDEVFSLNEETNEIEAKKVTAVSTTHISSDNNRYFYIYYNDSVIKATENHRFYTNGSYIRADELKVGDTLLDINQNKQKINDIKIVENSTDYVWDISVEGNSNFFVEGVLTHNASFIRMNIDHITMTVYYTEDVFEPGDFSIKGLNLRGVSLY